MIRVRKKTVQRLHSLWCNATEDWKIDDPKSSHYLYVLLFGIHHMLTIHQKEKARAKLGDLMFTGALLDWYYVQNDDDCSPVLFLWRVLGLEHAKKQYRNAIQDVNLKDVSFLYVLRQVVEFVRDAFGKELGVEVSKVSCTEHERLVNDGYDLSESYRQYALALKSDGESKLALQWMRKALEIQRRVLSPDNPDLYVSINSIASILNSLSMFEESTLFYEEAIENRTRLLGAEHPKTLISIASYAFLLNKIKEFDKAKPFHHQVLISRKEILGIKHPKTQNAMYNYASCLYPLGYITQSLALYKRCYELRMKILGSEHTRTINAKRQYKKLLNVRNKAILELDSNILSTDT
jgi:tetratricopeptide (TPR) repeat protein